MSLERSDCARIQRDHAFASIGLGGVLDNHPANDDALAQDCHGAAHEIDLGPLQAAGFPAP